MQCLRTRHQYCTVTANANQIGLQQHTAEYTQHLYYTYTHLSRHLNGGYTARPVVGTVHLLVLRSNQGKSTGPLKDTKAKRIRANVAALAVLLCMLHVKKIKYAQTTTVVPGNVTVARFVLSSTSLCLRILRARRTQTMLSTGRTSRTASTTHTTPHSPPSQGKTELSNRRHCVCQKDEKHPEADRNQENAQQPATCLSDSRTTAEAGNLPRLVSPMTQLHCTAPQHIKQTANIHHWACTTYVTAGTVSPEDQQAQL